MNSPAALAFPRRAADARLTWGHAPKSWGDFETDVRRLWAALSTRRGRTVVLCASDRYLFAVGLVAAWNAGLVVELPPNKQRDTVGGLAARPNVVALLHDGGWAGIDLRTAAADPSSVLPAHAAAYPANRPLVIVYTSGSTGSPAPHVKTAGQLLGEAAVLCERFGFRDAAVASTAPPHHLYGLLFSVIVPLVGGGTFARATPLYPSAIVDASAQATVLVSVPAHLEALAEVAPGSLDAGLRVFSSGAPLPPATAGVLRARHGLAVTEILGSSETGGIAWRVGTGPWTALPGVSIDADANGALLVDSPFLAPDAERPFRAADRIAPLGPGLFRHLGRGDSVVKIGGERVNVTAVEAILRGVAGVTDAAVVAVETPDTRQHELWAAVVAPAHSVASLRAALLRSLDPVAVPRNLRLVARLPRTGLGKMPLADLLALFDSDAGTEASA